MAILLKRNKWLWAVLLSLSLFSCDKGLRYEAFQKVDEQAWDYRNGVQFVVPIQEEETLQLSVALRNTAAYEHANIWLFLSIQSPSGKLQNDTLDCSLADDYGYWLGSGFSGLYLTEHALAKEISFDEKGEWSIEVTHGMRADSISGIKEVGILLKAQQDK